MNGGRQGTERKRVANCIVSVTMADMSDGEGWTDMETIQTKVARKKSWSEGGSEGESSPRQSVKKKKTITNGSSSEEEKEEWKVIITLSDDKGHFHPIQVTKAIEKKWEKLNLQSY